jgi:methylated-DNA-[protein]-cysteine S-methyltransferase
MITSVAVARGTVSTPVGSLTVTADASGVRRVSWQHATPSRPTEDSPAAGWVRVALDQLAEYFDGGRSTFSLPVDLSGLGASSRAVLQTLRDTVGAGETVSYGTLATRSGSGVPARAIGSIMGSNPVPIVVPCHRVVAADGIGGYSGGDPGRGRQTKLWLLEHEGALPPALI